jgi:hypothetical protein
MWVNCDALISALLLLKIIYTYRGRRPIAIYLIVMYDKIPKKIESSQTGKIVLLVKPTPNERIPPSGVYKHAGWAY